MQVPESAIGRKVRALWDRYDARLLPYGSPLPNVVVGNVTGESSRPKRIVYIPEGPRPKTEEEEVAVSFNFL